MTGLTAYKILSAWDPTIRAQCIAEICEIRRQVFPEDPLDEAQLGKAFWFSEANRPGLFAHGGRVSPNVLMTEGRTEAYRQHVWDYKQGGTDDPSSEASVSLLEVAARGPEAEIYGKAIVKKLLGNVGYRPIFGTRVIGDDVGANDLKSHPYFATLVRCCDQKLFGELIVRDAITKQNVGVLLLKQRDGGFAPIVMSDFFDSIGPGPRIYYYYDGKIHRLQPE